MNNQRTTKNRTWRMLITALTLIAAFSACTLSAAALGDSLDVRQSTTENKISQTKVIWDAYPEADYYMVQTENYVTGRRENLPQKVTQTYLKLTDMNSNTDYNVKVTAYDAANSLLASGSTVVHMLPTKCSGLALTKYDHSRNKVYFYWNKRASAGGYNFQLRSVSGNSKQIDEFVTGSDKNSTCFNSELKINMFYKARVRAFADIRGKEVYGKYSDWKYFSGGPSKVYLKRYKTRMKITWKKVSGATDYSVYISRKKPSSGTYSAIRKSMTKVATTKGTTYNLRKYKGKKFNRDKRYYVYVVARKKVGSKTYMSMPPHYYYVKNTR